MKYLFTIIVLVICSTAYASEKADRVIISKSGSTLYLYRAQKLLVSYPVVFGRNPEGHKEREGDGRTPEGQYILDYKKSDSAFHKAIHISYPNKKDREKAKKLGVQPGGSIMIHGQKNGLGWTYFISRHFNWTNGCIALSNTNMDSLWESVEAGTVIEIRP